MNPTGEGIREFVKSEGGLVGNHAALFGPEPERDKVLVFTHWEVDEAVDPSLGAEDTTGVDVLSQQTGGVAVRCRLLGREVATLTRGGLVEPVPVGASGCWGKHSRNVTVGSFLCEVPALAPGIAGVLSTRAALLNSPTGCWLIGPVT